MANIYALDPVDQTKVDEATALAGPLFGVIQNVFILIGVVLLVIVVFRVAKLFAKGDMSGVAKTAIGGLVAALLCFNLNLPIAMVSSVTSLAENVFTSIGKVANSGDGGGTDTPDTGPSTPAD